MKELTATSASPTRPRISSPSSLQASSAERITFSLFSLLAKTVYIFLAINALVALLSLYGKQINTNTSMRRQLFLKLHNLTAPSPIGTWGGSQGNTWIPPSPQRIHTPTEISKFFSTRSVLFLGDSTMRRAYSTLYSIMNSGDKRTPLTDGAFVDYNKLENVTCTHSHFTNEERKALHPLSICRTVPSTPERSHRLLDYKKANCYSSVTNFITRDFAYKNAGTLSFDAIVVGVGVHDLMERPYCLNGGNNTRERQSTSISQLVKLADAGANDKKVKIFWRTAGYHATQTTPEWLESNSRALSQIHKHNNNLRENDNNTNTTKSPSANSNSIVTVDWGREIFSKSFKGERISGDLDVHYGAEARMAFLQMLMNSMMETDKKVRVEKEMKES